MMNPKETEDRTDLPLGSHIGGAIGALRGLGGVIQTDVDYSIDSPTFNVSSHGPDRVMITDKRGPVIDTHIMTNEQALWLASAILAVLNERYR